MSRLTSSQGNFLRFFPDASPRQQRDLLRNLTPPQVKAITEVALNLLTGNIPLSAQEKKRLKRWATPIRVVANAKASLKKRKAHMTSRVVSTLLKLALPVLQSCEKRNKDGGDS